MLNFTAHDCPPLPEGPIPRDGPTVVYVPVLGKDGSVLRLELGDASAAVLGAAIAYALAEGRRKRNMAIAAAAAERPWPLLRCTGEGKP